MAELVFRGSVACAGLGAVRLEAPVRIERVRLTPESDGPSFTADVFYNLSPSDDAHALDRASVRVMHATECTLDMPPGVYGFPAEGSVPPKEKVELALPEAEELLAALPDSKVLPALRLLGKTGRLTLADALRSSHLAALTGAEDDGVLRSVLGLDGQQALDFAPAEALLALTRLDTPTDAPYPSRSSPLAQALALMRAQYESTHTYAPQALATVIKALEPLASAPKTAAALSRVLPEAVARATTGGADTALAVPTEHGRSVLAALAPLLAAEAWGRSVAPAAVRLAQPYLSTDEDRVLWTPAVADPGLGISGIQLQVTQTGEAARLARALEAPGSSFGLNPTPADVLATLAPELVASLGTAVTPPLGLPSTIAAGVGNASDYAGKVYSAHEFRRERDTTSGLGLGATGVGRKASRHVDEFGR